MSSQRTMCLSFFAFGHCLFILKLLMFLAPFRYYIFFPESISFACFVTLSWIVWGEYGSVDMIYLSTMMMMMMHPYLYNRLNKWACSSRTNADIRYWLYWLYDSYFQQLQGCSKIQAHQERKPKNTPYRLYIITTYINSHRIIRQRKAYPSTSKM